MSEIRATTISNAAGTGPITMTGQYAAKAWVNFNGTGTVAIRESGNVSGITDNGAGDYTINFTTAMVDANYVTELNGNQDALGSNFNGNVHGGTYTTSAVRIMTVNGAFSKTDSLGIYVTITR